MSDFKSMQADSGSHAFTPDQREALKRIFTHLANALGDVLLMKGKRVQASVTLAGSDSGFDLDCPFQPKTVLMLTARQGTLIYTQVPMQWTWTASREGGSLRLADYTGILAGPLNAGALDVDVFMERA